MKLRKSIQKLVGQERFEEAMEKSASFEETWQIYELSSKLREEKWKKERVKENERMENRKKELDYKFKLSSVISDMSSARWWQEQSTEERLDFAKSIAEREHAAELIVAQEFGKTPEPVEAKIKRIIAERDSLAKKYPIQSS